MRSTDNQIVWVFLAFTAIGLALTYYCWWIIRKHRRMLRMENLTGEQRFRSRFTVIIMFVPLLGFGIEFIYFAWKSLQTLALVVTP